MIKDFLSLLLAVCVIIMCGCNDPASIDAGLVNQDKLDIQKRDDISLTASTILEDSVTTYSPGGLQARYPCGIFDDPVFGQTTAELYFQVRYPVTFSSPNFESTNDITTSYDSLVLSLGIASDDAIYGDTTLSFDYEVYRVTDEMSNAESYSSNTTFETETSPLASFQMDENFYKENTNLNFYFSTETVADTIAPSVRVKLDDALGQELFTIDSMATSSNSEFLEVLKGFYIKPTSVQSAMPSFRFTNLTSAGGNDYSSGRLTLYYTTLDSDGVEVHREYNWIVDPTFSTKVINYEHDFSASIVDPFIGDETKGDSLLFIQGFSGTNVKIDIEDLSSLGDVIINKAEIEFYTSNLITDPDLYTLPGQVVVAEIVDEQISLISDFSLASQTGDITRSGGDMEEAEDGMSKYTLSISSHLQEIIDGDASNEIILRLFPKPSNVRRMAIYGPGHSTYPMKITLTYTVL